ncbi:peptidoglycan recognition protein [Streptomyces sp. NPDC059740]|uniref:peptidoglycan recognition protein family protein n=1 Tax=Streptomyces sp. NPDC059740 TaxID=3346926 RepID=UPI00365F2D02
MRTLLAASLGAACSAALSLPLVPAASAAWSAPADVTAGSRPLAAGSTQSLPLARLGGGGDRALRPGPAAADGAQGLPARTVRPFSLLGVVWDDPGAELGGRAQVRTRALGSGRWSPWQDLQAHDEDAPDLDAAERRGEAPRGATAPLWVGASDAVRLRVVPTTRHRPSEPPRLHRTALHPGSTARTPVLAPTPSRKPRGGRPDPRGARTTTHRPLPKGLRLELVDPGPEKTTARPAKQSGTTPARDEASAANAPLVKAGARAIPAAGRAAARRDVRLTGDRPPAHPRTGPRPRIVTRAGWQADESLRRPGFAYTGPVRAVFVHHSATGNHYTCQQAPAVIRAVYRYHVKSSHWRDLGYNFLVDKCGTVYEGRAGGVARPVRGAHTLGFNENTTGVAVLGSYDRTAPPKAVTAALARLAAWKLGLSGADPSATTRLVSRGGDRYPKGTRVGLKAISGHRDGFTTTCPGDRLYEKLGGIRTSSAHLQGR